MAQTTIDLKSEERRRQQTLASLGILLFATTLPVVNQRALFSPLGDVPILGDLTPVAYAAIFGGPANGSERVRGPGGRRPGGGPPPVAFALRVPGVPANAVPPSVGDSVPVPVAPPNVSNVPPLAPTPSNFGVGEAPPGLGGGGGSTSGGGGGGPTGGGGNMPGPIGAVPEPATWLTMIMGFAVVGVVMRRVRRRSFAPISAIAQISGD